MNVTEIYASLRGTSRVVQGELTIEGYNDTDYQNLYVFLLDALKEHIGTNYEYWYTKWARAYHRQKALSRHTFDFPDPQYEKRLDEQTIREQLATLKFFVTRRTYSKYGKK